MKRFISKSLTIASELYLTSCERFSHYAFIYSKNELISVGQNCTSRPDMKALYFGIKFNVPELRDWPFIHAETAAIGKLWGKRVITGKENIVVIRIGPNGLMNSFPCFKCVPVLKALNFKTVYHSTPNGVVESKL
jgi:hypothetical protein